MLLVFVTAGAAFVIFTQGAGKKGDDPDSGKAEVAVAPTPISTPKKSPQTPGKSPKGEPKAPVATPDKKPVKPISKPATGFAIESMNLKESGEKWVLELGVRYHNESDSDLDLSSPTAQLLTGEGAEVPAFFLAFGQLPIAQAESDELVELRFWLDGPQRDGNLELKILDETVVVALEKNDDGSVVRD